jgi:hypothetical protein
MNKPYIDKDGTPRFGDGESVEYLIDEPVIVLHRLHTLCSELGMESIPDGHSNLEDVAAFIIRLHEKAEKVEEIRSFALSVVQYWTEENEKDDQLYGVDKHRLEKLEEILAEKGGKK